MKPLLVALDVDTVDAARRLADTLRGTVGGFKIGSRLFTSEGPAMVRTLTERGDRVFLDLKFHDIPNTVGTAVAAATALGVWMVNVHASGGTAMMQAARDAARDSAAKHNLTPPLVIAVTVLTSIDSSNAPPGFASPLSTAAIVPQLLALAERSGARGIVCAVPDLAGVRRAHPAPFFAVTPGIRPGGAPSQDQKRVATLAEAVRAGSSLAVLGRAVTSAADPRAALEAARAQRDAAASLAQL